ncbi:elicitin [Phytophthora sojae]|uniref:Elicitin n=2 Tax=Phytophthora sojae TaxID=67593 RepID=G4ZVS0_PHYSP|nr:elicitin [Phytophthora sojae]ABB56012.1 elicitin-like protein SOL13E [Phytophthora sojae]EGZ11534.1 elicitin [Phytophthora sojae]|eukprot:XP_009531867.1 elicitin [Phytophthora sojae]
MTSIRSTLAVALLALVALQAAPACAANCTSDEQTTVDNVYADLANSTACADLIADTDASSLDYCMNSDCLSTLSDAVDELPDCTGEDEIDRKSGLQAIVTYCANVTAVMDQSASASGSATGSGSVVSAASRGSVPAAALSIALALAFVAGLV